MVDAASPAGRSSSTRSHADHPERLGGIQAVVGFRDASGSPSAASLLDPRFEAGRSPSPPSAPPPDHRRAHRAAGRSRRRRRRAHPPGETPAARFGLAMTQAPATRASMIAALRPSIIKIDRGRARIATREAGRRSSRRSSRSPGESTPGSSPGITRARDAVQPQAYGQATSGRRTEPLPPRSLELTSGACGRVRRRAGARRPRPRIVPTALGALDRSPSTPALTVVPARLRRSRHSGPGYHGDSSVAISGSIVPGSP